VGRGVWREVRELGGVKEEEVCGVVFVLFAFAQPREEMVVPFVGEKQLNVSPTVAARQ